MELPLWKAFILGIVQGLTEFLPISSSGHLVLFEHLLGLELPGVTFEVVAHAGTLLAVLVFYRHDVFRLLNGLGFGPQKGRQHNRRLLALVVVGTLPAVVVGLGLKSFTDMIFSSLRLVGFGWLITAAFLFIVDRHLKYDTVPVKRGTEAGLSGLNGARALSVGVLQAIAIWPGISRSGSTIAAGLMLGLDRKTAARFSFLLAIPAITGALVLDLGNIITTLAAAGASGASEGTAALAVAFAAAAASGYAAIHFLLRALERGRMLGFSVYCLVLGIVVLITL